ERNRNGVGHLHHPTTFVWVPVNVATYVLFFSVFFAEYFLICRVAIRFLQQFNRSVVDRLYCRRSSSALRHLRHFSHLYLMIQSLNIHLRRSYLAIMFASFGCQIFIFYGFFFTELSVVVKGAIFGGGIFLLVTILYLSVIAGHVDMDAKSLSKLLYQRFNIE